MKPPLPASTVPSAASPRKSTTARGALLRRLLLRVAGASVALGILLWAIDGVRFLLRSPAVPAREEVVDEASFPDLEAILTTEGAWRFAETGAPRPGASSIANDDAAPDWLRRAAALGFWGPQGAAEFLMKPPAGGAGDAPEGVGAPLLPFIEDFSGASSDVEVLCEKAARDGRVLAQVLRIASDLPALENSLADGGFDVQAAVEGKQGRLVRIESGAQSFWVISHRQPAGDWIAMVIPTSPIPSPATTATGRQP